MTPNLPEASAIIGGDPVTTIAEMREAAEAIHQLGPRLVYFFDIHTVEQMVLYNCFPMNVVVNHFQLCFYVIFLVLFHPSGTSS